MYDQSNCRSVEKNRGAILSSAELDRQSYYILVQLNLDHKPKEGLSDLHECTFTYVLMITNTTEMSMTLQHRITQAQA